MAAAPTRTSLEILAEGAKIRVSVGKDGGGWRGDWEDWPRVTALQFLGPSTVQSTQSQPERSSINRSSVKCKKDELCWKCDSPWHEEENHHGHFSAPTPASAASTVSVSAKTCLHYAAHRRFFIHSWFFCNWHWIFCWSSFFLHLTITSPSPPPPRHLEWTRHQGWRCRGPSTGEKKEARPLGGACKYFSLYQHSVATGRGKERVKPFSTEGLAVSVSLSTREGQ